MQQQTTLRRNRRQKKRAKKRGRLGLTLLIFILALTAVAVYFVTRFPADIESFSYPLEYTEWIDEYAGQYGLDSAHVAAVIYCESSFRPEAESYAGARGLMQIMPETGQWIAEKLNETDSYTDERLFEPELNIRYGCWFLGYLSGRFGGDLVKQTAAYHAGGTRVNEWLANAEYSPDGETLETIPIDATREYVRKVESMYTRYKQKYQELRAAQAGEANYTQESQS